VYTGLERGQVRRRDLLKACGIREGLRRLIEVHIYIPSEAV
jgi:hypothetical protein